VNEEIVENEEIIEFEIVKHYPIERKYIILKPLKRNIIEEVFSILKKKK